MTASPSTSLTIRRCVPQDLERVEAIERASFSDPWSFETFSATLALRHLRFLVAEEGGREGAAGGAVPTLLGYVVALVMADEGEIADLAIAPAARRRGIARSLLERTIADLTDAGVRALYLEVRESNAAARALYQALGFEPVGRRRGYYQRPIEDALLLRRDLAPT
jgi:ribosomal-protein-alanine N-acetyltransferase